MMKPGGLSASFDSRIALILAAFVAIVLFGMCDRMDPGPGEPAVQGFADDHSTLQDRDSGGRGFFPLDIGNRWTYVGKISITFENAPPSVINTREVHTLIGTEERFGREYILEEQAIVDDTGLGEYTYWIRFRQDRAGLYEADIPITEPPLEAEGRPVDLLPSVDGRGDRMAGLWQKISETIPAEYEDAYRRGRDDLFRRLQVIDAAVGRRMHGSPVLQGPPGGVLPDEITRLSYPLHPGQEWIIREDPLFASMVEAHDLLDLPPGKMNGFKIWILNPWLGPNDVVLIWYGRQGYLQLFVYMETEITDPGGNPIDTMTYEERLTLESLDLVGKGRF
jgi:hypothetical protein